MKLALQDEFLEEPVHIKQLVSPIDHECKLKNRYMAFKQLSCAWYLRLKSTFLGKNYKRPEYMRTGARGELVSCAFGVQTFVLTATYFRIGWLFQWTPSKSAV